MMPAPTHLIVANPAAQSGRNATRIDRVVRAFDTHGIRTHLLATLPHGQTVNAVRDGIRQGNYQCIIALGGDGTFREAAQGLLECQKQESITLGILPAGTANNLGRSFGMDTSERALEKNVKIIAMGLETRLDVGILECKTDGKAIRAMFVDSVGFGIGARVIAERNMQRRRIEGNKLLQTMYRDHRVYTIATLQTLRAASTRDEFGVTIMADGRSYTYPRLTELLIKGTRVYAGRWVIDRTSRHDDGFFEVMAFPDNRTWVAKGLVDLAGSDTLDDLLAAGGPSLPKPFRAARLDIQFHVPNGLPPPAVQVDGEEFPAAERFSVEVMPRAVRLVVPPSQV